MIALAIPNPLCAQSESQPFPLPVRRNVSPYSITEIYSLEHRPPSIVQETDTSTESSRIDRLEREIELLKASLESPQSDDAAVGSSRATSQQLNIAPIPEDDVYCEDCSPGYTLQPTADVFSSSKYPTVDWSGFLQLDMGWIIQDGANAETVGDIDSSTGLRRVRLRVEGNIRADTTYMVDLDFAADGHPSFRDVMLQLHDIPTLQNLRFGYFQQPFGMDALTSGRELLFLERGLPFALSPFRQTGISAYGTFAAERGTWATSTYWFPTDEFGVFDSGSGGHALAGRITLLPCYACEGDRLVHIGFDYSIGDPGDNTVRYAIQPGFFVTDPASSDMDQIVPTIVDTGDIPTNIYNLFNAEIGLGSGPFHVQSEARVSVVNQIGGPSLYFPGYYIQAGYVLTGESRKYDRQRGIFHQVTPRREFHIGRGGGAYEVTAAWSYLDLNDHNIEGGRASTLAAGLTCVYVAAHKVLVQLPVLNARRPEPRQEPRANVGRPSAGRILILAKLVEEFIPRLTRCRVSVRSRQEQQT